MTPRELEQHHLDDTITQIRQEMKNLRAEEQQSTEKAQAQAKQASEINFRAGSDEALYETSLEIRQHENEMLIQKHQVQSQQKRLNTLAVMEPNPYFARIDFAEDDGPETLYIGIASLRDQAQETLIVDWRAPISNLYYEGELGQAYYESDEKHWVELLLKRQFKIEAGQIKSMVDTNEMIGDTMLLEVLDEASTTHMKNIVATIQKEQNKIIRDTTSKVMLIEGIAGSGKTSALLQRVAFLLYRNRKWLNAEEVLLFSPNRLFSDYISTVLPSLGESEIPTQTFQSYIQQLLPKMEIETEADLEATFLSGKENPVANFKHTARSLRAVDWYIQQIKEMGPLFADLKLDQDVVISKQQIRRWYQETNPQLAVYQRITMLQEKLLKKLAGLEKDEAKKDWVKDQVETLAMEIASEDKSFDGSEKSERKLRRRIAMQLVGQKFKKIRRQIRQFTFIQVKRQYLHFLETIGNERFLNGLAIDSELWQTEITETKRRLSLNQLSVADSTLFFYLMKQVRPVHIRQKARFIFIDEMQDFTPAQLGLLLHLYPRSNYTLCGDLNQRILGNQSILGSLSELFTQELTQIQLTTSYRSTAEITNFANELLSEDDQVNVTARTGGLPRLYPTTDITTGIQQLQSVLKENSLRTAILTKTTEEAVALYGRLIGDEVQLITSENLHMKKNQMIIPAYLAKGLEFDRVIVWDANAENYQNEQDQLILYTLATRAMHELILFTNGTLSPLLANVPTVLYDTH